MSRNHTTNVMTIEFRLARHFVTFVILSAGLVVAAVHNDQPALSDHKREGKGNRSYSKRGIHSFQSSNDPRLNFSPMKGKL